MASKIKVVAFQSLFSPPVLVSLGGHEGPGRAWIQSAKALVEEHPGDDGVRAADLSDLNSDWPLDVPDRVGTVVEACSRFQYRARCC